MLPKNQFTSQPQYAVQINWSHPSARGLIACGLAPVAYDLVRKQLFADPKAAGAAPQGPLVPSPRNALGRAGGTGLFPFSYGQGFRLDTNNKYTALASVVLGGATASQGNAIFASSSSSTPASADSNGGELFFFNTTQRPILDVNSARVLSATSGPQIPLHEQKFVASRIVGGASGTYSVWWDGEQKYSGTHTSSIGALPVFYVGARVDPAFRTPRAFQAYWFWNRDLSDAELATLTQNPWQLFSPATSVKQSIFIVIFRPSSDVTVTGWTGSPDNVNLYANIDEPSASDTDYVLSPSVSSSPGPAIFGLSPSSLAAGNYTVNLRARRTGAAGQVRALLVDGSGTTVGTSSWQTLTTTYTTYNLEITTTGTAARLRFEVQA